MAAHVDRSSVHVCREESGLLEGFGQ
jgi:hypothetical protein